MKDLMVKAGGSIQTITDIPDNIKALYKTVWEISQKTIIDMARRSRSIHRSVSEYEPVYRKSYTFQIVVDAHVRLEIWSQNWDVLPA
jgi:hypothetical protein